MSLSGRSNVTFDPKVCHFTTVPMILYPPKVSSEHLVDDVGTSVNHHRNDPKVTILIKSAAFSSKTGASCAISTLYFPILPSYFSILRLYFLLVSCSNFSDVSDVIIWYFKKSTRTARVRYAREFRNPLSQRHSSLFFCILSLCQLKAFSYSMQRYNIFKPNPNISSKKRRP